MKLTVSTLLLTTIAAWSVPAMSEPFCYDVEGDVKTENTSPLHQEGTVRLLLLSQGGDEGFRQEGTIQGVVTGATTTATYLSHTVVFPDGSGFVTSDDEAKVFDVGPSDSSGAPCLYFIEETISNIVSGWGAFADVQRVEIKAVGYVNACLSEGENENEFSLSGELCVD
jgi:hypothetical protein